MEIKGKVNILSFIIALIGLVVIGYGCVTMLDAKIGELTGPEHEECSNFTSELVKNHSEYLKFDPQPYETCKDGVLKRNFSEGIKIALIGGLIICAGGLLKVFLIK
jgi:hypothetical protein